MSVHDQGDQEEPILVLRKQRNPYTHATIDLETLGTGTNPCVFEIGVSVATFNPKRNGLFNFNSKCYTFDLADAMRLGEVEAKTLAWWLTSDDISDDVRERLRKIWNKEDGKAPDDLYQAMKGINNFVLDSGAMSIWANGAAFDFPIIRNLFSRSFALTPSWSYHDEMCIRPVKRAHYPIWQAAKAEVEWTFEHSAHGRHSAEYDCMVNLNFLERVNRKVPLVHKEIADAVSNKPSK